MINIIDKAKCCGCNACGDICPSEAITYKTDIEGFWYPEVNMDTCIHCNLCERVCPIENIKELKRNDFEEPKCYAAIHKNLEVRFDSTSGGLFSAFAEKVYKENGFVGGAVFDDQFNVHHIISSSKSDLKALRSSKYWQSNLDGFYKEVGNVLESGKKVLVCGAPCQMAALRRYLKKDYENLYILDFVCRGIQTPKIAQKFDADLENKYGSKIVWQKAKNKELGWRLMAAKYIFANGKSLFLPAPVNPMAKGYLNTNAYCRPSCYECVFKGAPFISDITLADFWGIDKVDKSMDDNIGTSLVMVNSIKGAKLFESIEQKIKYIPVTFDDAKRDNVCITESLPPSKIDRDAFFKDLDNSTFVSVANKYFPFEEDLSFKRKLKNLAKSLIQIKNISFGHPLNWIRLFWLNYVRHSYIKTNLSKGGYIYLSPYVVSNISHKANILLNASFTMGTRKLNGSKIESRLLVEDGATLEVNSSFACGYGTNIEIFSGARLIIKSDFENIKGGGPNMGLTIICGNSIEIGEDCRIGRNVTIRDNNGGHYLSLQGYKTSKPVVIGQHVWLCESCTIMQGVKIGDGAIVAAHAVVVENVPPYSLVAGNPAKVIERDIHWKY